MLHLSRILVSSLVLAASAVSLSACGQQGPLYLPTKPVAAKVIALPQTQNPAAPTNPSVPASATAAQ